MNIIKLILQSQLIKNILNFENYNMAIIKTKRLFDYQTIINNI